MFNLLPSPGIPRLTDRTYFFHLLLPNNRSPSRFLSVSLEAFGYTGASRKWISAQALEVSKADTTVEPRGDGPTPNGTATGLANTTRRKSTSPAPPRNVERPERLNRDHEGEDYVCELPWQLGLIYLAD